MYRNIVGRNMLRAFGHGVAMCCNMLGVIGSSLEPVKFEPTTPNMSQHVATRWPNARNMLRPTMLRYVLCWHVAIVWPGLKKVKCLFLHNGTKQVSTLSNKIIGLRYGARLRATEQSSLTKTKHILWKHV